MTSRLDVVIFGATGFTGKYAVEAAVRISRTVPLTWAVAGRSQEKLNALIRDVSRKMDENLSSTRIIVADVGDEQSLKDMTLQAKVIANCCGPFRLYGEQVVKACIDTKTHYVDVSGEPQFMETMQLGYGAAARDAGVYVVSACGFDCVPNDMGVVFLQQHFGGTLNSVESYISIGLPLQDKVAAKQGVFNYTTWESLVHSLSHADEIPTLRKKLYPEQLPTFKPILQKRGLIHKRDDKWWLPFYGADRSVVYRTQRHFYDVEKERPVQFTVYFGFKSLFTCISTLVLMVLLYAMTRTDFTRKMLFDYPNIFSFGFVTHDEPEEEIVNNTTYTMRLHGSGWSDGVTDVESTPPDEEALVEISGMNPGYGTTTTALLYCALTILREKHNMPPRGGVLTTGAAFSKTSLIDKLMENGFSFKIISNQ